MRTIWLVPAVGLGIIIGGYLFRDVAPRSFLALDHCNATCLKVNELTGLLGSIVVQKSPELLPLREKETDKTIVLKYPTSPLHFVIIPKKDTKNIGQLAHGDEPYLIDIFSVVESLIQENNLVHYKVYSRGPGDQDVAYLHFHLVETK